MKIESRRLVGLCVLLVAPIFAGISRADTLNVAVAANMKAAFAELAAEFQRAHPGDRIEANYGSSGKFAAQIANGAPYQMFYSADTAFPQKLMEQGLVTGGPRIYAIGHLVLWSRDAKTGGLPVKQLPAAIKGKLAIANPATSPYGGRAREAMQHEGVWEALRPRLVFGENITQTAQFIDTGAAEAGFIALSQVLGAELKGKGAFTRIPADWHQPLDQSFVILKPGADKALPKAFADYMTTKPARDILARYGYDVPQRTDER